MKSVVLLLCVLFTAVLASIAPEFIDEIPSNISALDSHRHRIVFDFIVIGAGAAGCIVASRLANETNKHILLLEGGAKGTGQRDIGGTDYVAAHFVTDPITGKQRLGRPLTRYDIPMMSDTIRQAKDVLDSTWNITQVGFFYDQAKVVGGNQAANGAGWFITQKADLDNWNLPGYNSTEFFPYFTRLEDATATGYTSGRGSNGPIHVEFASFLPLEQSMFIAAAEQAGYGNGGDFSNGSIGIGYYLWQYSTEGGIRETSSTKFLAKVHKRNLDFRTSAVVTRVLFDFLGNAIGVEYADSNGVLKKVYALKEVIITAGALQSAKILFNSGIGPESILTAFGKPLRVVNEIIGQKVRNHQRSAVTYSSPNFLLPNFYTMPAASVQYARDGSGLFNRQLLTVSAQVSPTAPYPELFITISASGITATDPYGNNLVVSVYLNQFAYANGTLNLTSSDPLAGTFYDPHALVVESDAELVAKGFLEVRRIMSYWNGSITEISPGAGVTSLPDLIAFAQANAFTAGHLYSSVPMGTDSSAPTDPRMFVRGVQKLRVVGVASAPGSVFYGMQALAMALGEKGTDLIKEDHGL